MEQILQQLAAHVNDEKFFSARAFRHLSEQTGVMPCQLAQAMAIVLALYLELGECAFFVANSLLIAYPVLTCYVFPEERPVRDLLLVYWGCFGLLTAFDRFLEAVPLYYICKMCLLALFFLEPCSFAEKINKLIEVKLEENNLLTSSELRKICRRTGRSPIPQKPVDLYDDKKSKEAPKGDDGPLDPTQKSDSPRARKSAQSLTQTLAGIPPKVPPPAEDQETKTARLPASSRLPVSSRSAKEVKTAELPAAAETTGNKDVQSDVATAIKAGGLTDGRPLATSSSETNIMARDSSYRLRTDGIDNKDIGPASNIHDLILWPQDQLVFNAPLHHDNLTYHMTMMNNSQHRMAFVIKGNAIPRVTAYPAHGILDSKKKMIVAVTMKAFEWNEFNYGKDRICWEYVLLKEDDKVEKFSHKLLQNCEWKRRKNIKILYNV